MLRVILTDVADKQKKRNKPHLVFYFFSMCFTLFAHCKLVYISDIACGLEFDGVFIFNKTGNVTTLIYEAFIPFFLVFVYKV